MMHTQWRFVALCEKHEGTPEEIKEHTDTLRKLKHMQGGLKGHVQIAVVIVSGH